jgi:hypothetical protein
MMDFPQINPQNDHVIGVVVLAVAKHAEAHPVADIARLNILDRLPLPIQYLTELNAQLSQRGNR